MIGENLQETQPLNQSESRAVPAALGDCHIHMVLDGSDFRVALNRHREGAQDGWIRERLTEYAAGGVRFLRDGGDALGAARRAKILAPEYGIDYREPGFPICRKGRYGGFIGRTFSDFAEYRALVDEAIALGADFIKIMISGLIDFNQFGALTSTPLDRAEIADMIAYAHDRGMAVMAHANGARTVRDALDAGVDSVEHGAYMDAECVAQLAASGTVWVPTLATIGNLIGCGRHPNGILRQILEFQSDNVRKCIAMGGTVAAGSDSGAHCVPQAKGRRDEIALLLKAGATMESLRAAEVRISERFRR